MALMLFADPLANGEDCEWTFWCFAQRLKGPNQIQSQMPFFAKRCSPGVTNTNAVRR